MWDFISHYTQNKINYNRVRHVVSVVADSKFRKRKEMALISTISSRNILLSRQIRILSK